MGPDPRVPRFRPAGTWLRATGSSRLAGITNVLEKDGASPPAASGRDHIVIARFNCSTITAVYN